MSFTTVIGNFAFALLLLTGSEVAAQLTINNATFHIESGATVSVQSHVTSNVDISGDGKLLLNGTSNQNINMNGFSVPNLELDNPTQATLTGAMLVANNLLFTRGRIQLDDEDLSIAASPAGSITGASNTRYVVTNGVGRLVKKALNSTPFTYPLGYSHATYNPITVANPGGTPDDIGVFIYEHAYSNGYGGSTLTKEMVDASWEITEAVAGGSNLSITAFWNASDELSGFNRNTSGISYYIATPGPTEGWDMLNSQTGAAAGANPYSYTRTNITETGVFAVGNRPVLSPLLVSPKIILQGPALSNGIMNDGLRTVPVNSGGTTDATHGVIPLADPYTGLSGFTHLGSGGGETLTPGVLGVFNVTDNNSIVDWVFVSIHDGNTGNAVSTRSALVQRDGDVVDTDGVSPVNMAGNIPDNYFISIRHRNHLGVRSFGSIPLVKTVNYNYNFTANLGQAMNGVAPNNAMAYINPPTNTIFGLWGGDATGNKVTRYSGPGNDENQLLNVTLGGNKLLILSGVYSRSDLNMNGNVRYAGPANDENTLLNTIMNGVVGMIISQPNF